MKLVINLKSTCLVTPCDDVVTPVASVASSPLRALSSALSPSSPSTLVVLVTITGSCWLLVVVVVFSPAVSLPLECCRRCDDDVPFEFEFVLLLDWTSRLRCFKASFFLASSFGCGVFVRTKWLYIKIINKLFIKMIRFKNNNHKNDPYEFLFVIRLGRESNRLAVGVMMMMIRSRRLDRLLLSWLLLRLCLC